MQKVVMADEHVTIHAHISGVGDMMLLRGDFPADGLELVEDDVTTDEITIRLHDGRLAQVHPLDVKYLPVEEDQIGVVHMIGDYGWVWGSKTDLNIFTESDNGQGPVTVAWAENETMAEQIIRGLQAEVWVMTMDGENGLSCTVYWKPEDAYSEAVSLIMDDQAEDMEPSLREAIEAELDPAKAWAMVVGFLDSGEGNDEKTIIAVEKVKIV